MFCDATTLNTGRLNETCINIEQSLNKQLLFFACRHHMLELIIGAVVTACMYRSTTLLLQFITSKIPFPFFMSILDP